MLLTIVILLMLIGFVGIFVPGLPGIGLIFISALGYGFFTDFVEVNGFLILIFAGMTVLALLFDYIGGLLGAKKFGASKAGIVWGIIGGIVGLLSLGLLGLVLGQFIGTVGGELLQGKKLDASMKSGIGALIGYILGVAVNTSIGLIMIVLFIMRVM